MAGDLSEELLPSSKRLSILKRDGAAAALGALAVFVMGGLVFGFNALKPVMYDERVYQDVCDGNFDDDGDERCTNQTLKLNLMYTVGLHSSITLSLIPT